MMMSNNVAPITLMKIIVAIITTQKSISTRITNDNKSSILINNFPFYFISENKRLETLGFQH